MASGSSAGRAANSVSKAGFGLASDTIFSTYDECDIHQDSFNGSRSDPVTGTNPSKDFHTTRVSRSSAFLPNNNTFSQPEGSLNLEVITIIERTMKKYTDNQMRFLEGLSSRLSQLELYCYSLDKSIGEMQSDLGLHNGEANTKLKSMDKHLQEVHRSVQILRDKQEVAETQKELELKLELIQKESSHSQEEDKSSSTPGSQTKNTDDTPEIQNQQLALALPNQFGSQPAPPSMTSQMTSQTITQQPPYYLPQLPIPEPQTQPPQTCYLPADPQNQVIQLQGKVNHQPPQSQVFPQYQQQWSQMTTTGPESTHYPAYIHSQPQASSASGGRSHHPPPTHLPQSVGYPPANAPLHMIRAPSPSSRQLVRNHRYGDLIEKLVSMGYREDNVETVIQWLEESGQVVDFNAVLDRLNIGHSSGGSQRSW